MVKQRVYLLKRHRVLLVELLDEKLKNCEISEYKDILEVRKLLFKPGDIINRHGQETLLAHQIQEN